MQILALVLIAAAVLADQLIKLLVVNQLKPVGSIDVIPGFLDFTYVQNYGAAFGILQNQKWFFIVATSFVSLVIIVLLFTYKNHNLLSYAASVLIVGGGIGNLIDRIHLGYVVDYIHLSFFSPVFNFADCCVTVGTALLIIHVIFFAESKGKHDMKHLEK